MKFGKLTVVDRAPNLCRAGTRRTKVLAMWNCLCECGTPLTTRAGDLVAGKVKSCGCSRSWDITGQRFNHLTAIAKVAPDIRNEKGKYYWKCQCDCGATTEVRIDSLLNGRVGSCGCSRKENLIGKKFGALVVVELLPVRRNSETVWLCQCDCGNTTEVLRYSLVTGNTQSCGANLHRRIELKGERFGRLLVIGVSDSKPPSSSSVYWDCVCDCGKLISTSSSGLRSGNTQSCGCLRRERIVQSRLLPINVAGTREIIRQYKGGAVKRGLEWALTDSQVETLILANCHYCGVSPSRTVTPKIVKQSLSGKFNGIDRMDSSKGYTADNVVSCCKTCNLAKVNTPYDEFITYLDQVSHYRFSLAGGSNV